MTLLKKALTLSNRPIKQFSVGRMSKTCTFCGSKRFAKEILSSCCLNGKVALPSRAEIPQQLKELIANSDFKNNIRKYNQGMAWTSLGANVDQRFANQQNGFYTFRIQGQLHHKIGSLLPGDNELAKFGQIYFMDSQDQGQRRADIFDLCPQIFRKLKEILNYCQNPYIGIFKQARDVTDIPSLSIRIFANDPDPRRYNAPSTSEVAALIFEDENCDDSRDIILTKQNGQLKRIKSTHVAYDALSYPILFPFGQPGWSPALTRQGDSKKITLMDYNKYYLQCRSTYNVFHNAGRLFQQYVVDAYARIEQDRLLFLRFNQKKLRAECYQGVHDRILDNNQQRIGKNIVFTK